MSAIASGLWPQKPPAGTPAALIPYLPGSGQIIDAATPPRLRFAMILNDYNAQAGREMTRRLPYTLNSGCSWTRTKDGPAVAFTGATNNVISVADTAVMSNLEQTGFTVEVITTQQVNVATYALFGRGNSVDPGPFQILTTTSETLVQVGNGGDVATIHAPQFTGGQRTHLITAVKWTGSGHGYHIVMVANGKFFFQGTGFLSSATLDTANPWLIGNKPGGGAGYLGVIALAACWQGVLTLPQMIERCANPWALADTAGLSPVGPAGIVPPPPVVYNNWHFINPQFGAYVTYLGATPSRISSLKVEFNNRAVVLKGGMADTALQWYIQNTPPALRWQS